MQCKWKQCVHSPITVAKKSTAVLRIKYLSVGCGPTYWAVIAGILALGACALELHAADAAGVVGVFGEIPLPLCDGVVDGEGDFHAGR